MIERPKILSAIVVPTGGWAFVIDLSKTTDYDTAVTATLPAGTYYLSDDHSSSDLLDALCKVLTTAIQATGSPFSSSLAYGWLDAAHKVNLAFPGGWGGSATKIKISWSNTNPSLVLALGGPSASGGGTGIDATMTAADTTYTCPYPHAYGWYADGDGWLKMMPLADIASMQVLQARSLGGLVRSQQISSILYDSNIAIELIPNVNMLSFGNLYGYDPPYPAVRNQPLECLWYDIVGGKQFRIYRNYSTSSARNNGGFTANGGSSSSLTNSAGSIWTTSQWVGFGALGSVVFPLAYGGGNLSYPAQPAITANTASSLTVGLLPGSPDIYNAVSAGWVFVPQAYQTYVIDASEKGDTVPKFAPVEVPNLDQFNISIPLMRYVAP